MVNTKMHYGKKKSSYQGTGSAVSGSTPVTMPSTANVTGSGNAHFSSN